MRTQDFKIAGYSWHAKIGHAAEQLVKAVRENGVFNAETIEAFDRSRKLNGSYTIHSGDLVLINNAKSLINMLQSLQQISKGVVEPLLAMRAEGLVSMGLLDLGLNLPQNVVAIIQLIKDIRDLSTYLKELKSALTELCLADQAFLPLVTELQNTILEQIQPLIHLLQSSPANNNKDEQKKLNDAVNALQQVAGEINKTAKQSKTTVKSIDFTQVYHKIGVLQLLIKDNTTADRSVLDRVNHTLSHFQSALRKIDAAINHGEIHIIDLLKELEQSIKELKQIDLESIKLIGAEELLNTIKAIMQQIEPLLINIDGFIERAEIRFGLSDDLLISQFSEFCKNYEILAKTLGITLTAHYPYWEERLQIRESELTRKEMQLEQPALFSQATLPFALRERERLQEKVMLAKEAIITTQPQSDSGAVKALLNLRAKIRTLSPEALFLMPLEDLHRLVVELKGLENLGAQGFINILMAALEDRCGYPVLLKQRNELRAKIKEHPENEARVKARLATLTEKAAKLGDVTLNLNTIADLKDEQTKLKSQSNTWWIGNLLYENPLVGEIDKKIAALEAVNDELYQLANEQKKVEEILETMVREVKLNEEKAKQLDELTMQFLNSLEGTKPITDLPLPKSPHRYSGAMLSTWDLAQHELLRAIQDNILALVTRDIPKNIHIEKHAVELTESTLKETQMLRKKSLHDLRQAIVHSLDEKYLAELKASSLANGSYAIQPTDTLLIKNIKLLLNILRNIEELLKQFQKLNYLVTSPFVVSEVIKTAQQLGAELNDFAFYLSQISKTFSTVFDVSQQSLIEQLNEMAPALMSLKDCLSVPQVSEIFNFDLTANVNEVLVKLQAVAHPAPTNLTTEVFNQKGLLDQAITKLDAYIQAHSPIATQLLRDAKGMYALKEPGLTGDFKNIVVLANALRRLQAIQFHLSAKEINIQDVAASLRQVYLIYKTLKKIDMTRLAELQEVIAAIVQQIHTLLTDAVSKAELLKLQLGIEPAWLEGEVGHFCRQFERMAEKWHIDLEEVYPYTLKRRELISGEGQLQQIRTDHLKQLKDKIIANQTLSLSELMLLRNELSTLPPSQRHKVLDDINKMIATLTNSPMLDIKISDIKKKLANIESDYAVIENKLATVQAQMSEKEKLINKLMTIDALLSANQPLSMADIQLLYSLSNMTTSHSIGEFCQQFVYEKEQRDAIHTNHLFVKLAEVRRELEDLKDKEEELNDEIDAKLEMYQEKKAELVQFEAVSQAFYRKLQTVPAALWYDENANAIAAQIPSSLTIKDTIEPMKVQLSNSIDELINLSKHKENICQQTITGIDTTIKQSLEQHKLQLQSLQKTLGFRQDDLINLLTTNPNQIRDLHKAAQEAEQFNHLQGLFKAIAGKEKNEAVKNIYNKVLQRQYASQEQFIAAMKSTAKKESSFIGRFFRKWQGELNSHDIMYMVASHYTRKENYERDYTHLYRVSVTITKELIGASSALDIATELTHGHGTEQILIEGSAHQELTVSKKLEETSAKIQASASVLLKELEQARAEEGPEFKPS